MTNHTIYHGSDLRNHRRMEGSGIFFVTKCLKPRKPIITKLEKVASAITDSLIDEVRMERMRLAAFCIMPDHWHALFAPVGKQANEIIKGQVRPQGRAPTFGLGQTMQVRPQGRAPTFGLGQTMQRLSTWISRHTNRELTKYSCCWQKGYYETRIRSGKQFGFVCHYIEENPVKAGLVNEKDAWLWSSANPDHQDYIERPWQTLIT